MIAQISHGGDGVRQCSESIVNTLVAKMVNCR